MPPRIWTRGSEPGCPQLSGRGRRKGSAGIGIGRGVAPESGSPLTAAESRALPGPLAPAPSLPSGPSPEAQVAGRIQWDGCRLLGDSRPRAKAGGPGRPCSPQLPGGAGDPLPLPAPNSRLLPAARRARSPQLAGAAARSLTPRAPPRLPAGWGLGQAPATGLLRCVPIAAALPPLPGDRVPNPKAE